MEDGYEYIAYVGSSGSTLVFVKFSDTGSCYINASSMCLTDCYAYVYKVTASGVSTSILSQCSKSTVTSFLAGGPIASTVDIYNSAPPFMGVYHEKTIVR